MYERPIVQCTKVMLLRAMSNHRGQRSNRECRCSLGNPERSNQRGHIGSESRATSEDLPGQLQWLSQHAKSVCPINAEPAWANPACAGPAWATPALADSARADLAKAYPAWDAMAAPLTAQADQDGLIRHCPIRHVPIRLEPIRHWSISHGPSGMGRSSMARSGLR